MKEVEIDSIGKLLPHPEIPDEWFISEPISIPFFEGKELRFTLSCDLEDDKDFLADVNQVTANFLKMNVLERNTFSKRIYENYQEIQTYYDSEAWGAPPLKWKEESEIWKYVYPQEIMICQGYNQDENIYVLITCSCKWEEEHGLQLVFKNGIELTRVSAIDYSPTE